MPRLLMIGLVCLTATSLARADRDDKSPEKVPAGTIAFPSLAPRDWDLYVVDVQTRQSRRLTDHPALDYNAAFSPDGRTIAFVSERDGNFELYTIQRDGSNLKRLTANFAMDDHPAWSPDGKRIAFVSTRQPADKIGQAWNRIYVVNADGSEVQRLSGKEAADYSPAWSPRGNLIAFASGSGVAGGADLFVMKPDGSSRRRVIKDGGWPAFAADAQHLFFHSKRDGKWGIWKVGMDSSGLERITPGDVEAYTPRASADRKQLVLALQRGQHRQIEIMDLESRKLTALTKEETDHWNPAISADGRYVVYHKSRLEFSAANVELRSTPPGTNLQMVRVGGAFPAFSPDAKRLALTTGNFSRLDVMNVDGSGRKTIFSSKPRNIFSISWAHQGDWIAFSHGKAFQEAQGTVDITLVRPDGSEPHPITEKAGNNGFPAFAPDSKHMVFRSGREGSKNLYIMNAGGTELRRLTEGKWTDTMADWSPDGKWIAFASDRDGNFDVFLIQPDGTGLRKLVGGGGRNNHPHFSPAGSWIVFVSQRAGYSAEEISLPHQFQPYGDLFLIRTDGTGLVRLTQTPFEEGPSAWGPVLKIDPSAEGQKRGGGEY